MLTKAQKKEVAEVLDKFTSLEDPNPMDPDRQAFFQRLCTKEAERLRYFLTKHLSQEARKEVADFEQYFLTASTLPVVAVGVSRSLAPYMDRTLTAYRTGEVQSYRRRPKGKLYERL